MIYRNFKIGEEDYFILPMKLEDLSRFKEIRDQCLEYIHNDREYTYQETVFWYLFNNVRYLSVYTKDKMIGYVRLSTSTKSCHIGMDLDPEYRGKSIAATTYNTVIDELNKYGISEFYLRVLQNNDHAVKLYKALDFKILETRENVVTRNGKKIGDFLMVRKEDFHKPIDEKIKPVVSEIIDHLQTKNV